MSGTYDYWQTRQLNRGLDQAQRRRRRRLAEPLPHEPSLAQLTAEMLHDVLVDRMAQGERAPGPDGIRLSDLSRSDGWEICRQLAWRIKAGKFQPSMARAIRLPKPDGSSRTINIRSIAFGLVAGAVHRILQPKLEAPMEESSIDSNQSAGEARGLLDQAESAWLSLMSGGDASVRDALSTQLAQSLSDLAEPGDMPLVTLLVRQVALTQLQAAFADATYALCKDVSLPQAKFLLERQRIMSRKLLQSTKALAEVRKLTNRSIRRPKEASASPPS